MVILKIETDQEETDSLEGVKFSVSFDGGKTFDSEYRNLDATIEHVIKETGLKVKFEVGNEPLEAGYVYKIKVQAARTPNSKEELYK